ncbi:MAG: Hsp20/alpha crystallin family protein [Clostridia bacterium]|nr:Hsp20/alpha crystallin family protein [Clostridia bacterium]
MFELIPYATRRNSKLSPFEDFYRDFWSNPMGEIKTDITDIGDAYKLEADLPGFKKDDIKIELNGKRMVISAERKSESEETDKQGYVRRERTYGSFTRSFDVSGIETGEISASYTDGVLTMNLPKKAELKPEAKQIAID